MALYNTPRPLTIMPATPEITGEKVVKWNRTGDQAYQNKFSLHTRFTSEPFRPKTGTTCLLPVVLTMNKKQNISSRRYNMNRSNDRSFRRVRLAGRTIKRTTACTGTVFSIILFLILLTGTSPAFGQGVGISESSITPDASAILELRSSQRGFLPPRMTEADRDAIASPADGLIIYNTDTKKLNLFIEGTGWRVMFSGLNGVNSVSGTADRITITGTDDPRLLISRTIRWTKLHHHPGHHYHRNMEW